MIVQNNYMLQAVNNIFYSYPCLTIIFSFSDSKVARSYTLFPLRAAVGGRIPKRYGYNGQSGVGQSLTSFLLPFMQ